MKYTVRGLEVKVSGECLRDKINGDMNFSVEELHLEGNFEEIMTTAFELFNEIANVTKPEVNKEEVKTQQDDPAVSDVAQTLWKAFVNDITYLPINNKTITFTDSVRFSEDGDREITTISSVGREVEVPSFYRKHPQLSKEKFFNIVKEFANNI